MKYLLWLLTMLFCSGLYAQEPGILSGTIKDQEVFDEGLVFARVRLKDTDLSTQTNFRGNFELKNIAPGTYTLEVSYAGYETLEIPVLIRAGESTEITHFMSAKMLSMEDLSSLKVKPAVSSTNRESELGTDLKR